MSEDKELKKILGDLINIKTEFLEKEETCFVCGFPFSKEVREKAIDQAIAAILKSYCKKDSIVVNEEKIQDIVQNALEKAITEDKTIYNEEQLFDLLGRLKLVENLTRTLSQRISEVVK